jgi:hypothetical protein
MNRGKLISSKPSLTQVVAVFIILAAVGIFLYTKNAGIKTTLYFLGASAILICWSVQQYWKMLAEVYEYEDYLQIRKNGKNVKIHFSHISECRLQSGIASIVLLAPGKLGRVIQFIPGNEFESSEVSRKTRLFVQQKRAQGNLSRQEGKLISSAPRPIRRKALGCAVVVMPIACLVTIFTRNDGFLAAGILAMLAVAWYLVFAWNFADSVLEFEDFLMVARRGKKEKVRFSNVEKIRISHLSATNAIIFIHLRAPSTFGSRIRFCPGDGYEVSEVSRRCQS